MTKPPSPTGKTPDTSAAASGQERGQVNPLGAALDPLANALKKAVQTGAELVGVHTAATAEPAKPATGKPGLAVSPLAVDLSARVQVLQPGLALTR